MSAKSTTSGDEVLPSPVIYEFAPVSRQLAACDTRYNLLTGAAAAEIAQTIGEEVRASKCSVLSLDVFDTLLLRNDKAETMRFYELSQLIRDRLAQVQNGKPDDLPSAIDFLLARLYGMDIGYRTRKAVDGCREGHIREVVRTASRSLGLPPEAETLMLDAEIGYEADNLRMNPVLLEVIAAFRENGGKVILLSDMYLGRAEIESIIKRLDARAPDLIHAIFSSADCIVSKRSGKMFAFVEKELELPSESFFHVGDALDGDVYKPREAGWRALHFPVSRSESARRNKSLAAFDDEMRGLGHDLTRWSKV